MKKPLLLAPFLCALCMLLAGHSNAGPLSQFHANRARQLILGLDLDDAKKELQQGDAGDPEIQRERGRLALYEADCDTALVSLAAATTGGVDEETDELLDIARGCARVTAAIVQDEVKTSDVVVRYQDEADRALTPLIVETVEKARATLTKDLGVTWPKPTRVIMVRDLLSLSAMTGLPYESAQTTGTVAIAKWGRVTILSPRASHNGYPWRDTLAHELTHLAVTRLTIDRAPLWLQEGLAKREEVRWREPGPYDDRPSPDVIARRGIEKKLDLALDQLGPSIAMLPSAKAAMVAFAEVTSFVRYYAKVSGDDAVKKLLSELRDGKKIDAALVSASGSDLKGWDAKWRAEITSVPSESVMGIDDMAHDKGMTAVREKLRAAELLFGRDHVAEAQKEIDQVKSSPLVAHDPGFEYLAARVLEKTDSTAARAKVADPSDPTHSYAPWWAIRGRLAVLAHDGPLIEPSFAESIASDPFGVEGTCRSLDGTNSFTEAKDRDLCRAAVAAGVPDLGKN
jgi:Peptidase MA superfamily